MKIDKYSHYLENIKK